MAKKGDKHMRLIDADKVIANLTAYMEREQSYSDIDEENIPAVEAFKEAIQEINEQPTVEPRKGKWIHNTIETDKSTVGYFYLPSCFCSMCGTFCAQESNYCPNCGAEMSE